MTSVNRIRAFGLIESVAALAIGLLVSLALTKGMINNQKSEKHLQLKAQKRELYRLSEMVNCEKTFEMNGLKDFESEFCDSSSKEGGQNPDNGLRLFRTSAKGMALPLTGRLLDDGSAYMGQWRMRATCSRVEETLVVRIARKHNDRGFLKDPLTGSENSWYKQGSLLFGTSIPGDAVLPLCSSTSYGGGPLKPIPPAGLVFASDTWTNVWDAEEIPLESWHVLDLSKHLKDRGREVYLEGWGAHCTTIVRPFGGSTEGFIISHGYVSKHQTTTITTLPFPIDASQKIELKFSRRYAERHYGCLVRLTGYRL
jgi:hypothetical protein